MFARWGDNETVVDTCGGDSGGPLMTTEGPGVTKLVGLTSFGSPLCNQPDVPGVYTRLANADITTFVGDPTAVPAQVHSVADSPCSGAHRRPRGG